MNSSSLNLFTLLDYEKSSTTVGTERAWYDSLQDFRRERNPNRITELHAKRKPVLKGT